MKEHTLRNKSTILPANPRANYLSHRQEIDEAIKTVLEKGFYILAEQTAAFEKEFAEYISVKYAVGVGSGTEALHLALKCCDIGPGDEVITVSHTAVATVAAIELCGATPVFVDIDLDTYTMDCSSLVSAISPKTKAILPVHLYGHPADMNLLSDFAKSHSLRVVEDCAQSHGAAYRGRKTGSLGDIAAFSFYPTKNLGALGDAGIVVTNNVDYAQKAKLLREYGWEKRYLSEISGWNTRLDEIQAAVLRVKLHHLDADNACRNKLASMYLTGLTGIDLIFPQVASYAQHCYHQFVIRCQNRPSLQEYLKNHGIGTLIHYPIPVHMQPAYRGKYRTAGILKNTEKIAGEILSLPLYPEMSNEQVNTVINAILSFYGN